MRILERIHKAALLSAGALGFLVVAASGCHDNAFSNLQGDQVIEDAIASLDARGSSVVSEVAPHQHTAIEGTAGPGGRVALTGAAVSMTSDPNVPPIVPPALTPGAPSLTVNPGQTMEVHGVLSDPASGAAFSYVLVSTGGTLVLKDHTSIGVTGDVNIQGRIVSDRDGPQDGADLILSVGGRTVVSGLIDLSGHNAPRRPAANRPPGATNPPGITEVGGNGGQLTIVSAGDVFILGTVSSNGGGNDSQDSRTGRAGAGGTVSVTSTGGSVFFSGTAGARAGNSFTNDATPGPAGGTISLTAAGAITMQQINSINVTGGRTTGPVGGGGGTFEVIAASFSMNGVQFDGSGGRVFYRDGTAGNGGTFSVVTTGSITIGDPPVPPAPPRAGQNMTIRVNGGPAIDEGQQTDPMLALGGDGGTILLDGAGLTVIAGVSLVAQGGQSLGPGQLGGAGGSIQLASTGIAFDGTGDVRGGLDEGGSAGTPGTVCSGELLSTTEAARFVGFTPPIATCP